MTLDHANLTARNRQHTVAVIKDRQLICGTQTYRWFPLATAWLAAVTAAALKVRKLARPAAQHSSSTAAQGTLQEVGSLELWQLAATVTVKGDSRKRNDSSSGSRADSWPPDLCCPFCRYPVAMQDAAEDRSWRVRPTNAFMVSFGVFCLGRVGVEIASSIRFEPSEKWEVPGLEQGSGKPLKASQKRQQGLQHQSLNQ